MSTELAIINLTRELEKHNYILEEILKEIRKKNKEDKIQDIINSWYNLTIEDENNFDNAPETIQEINNILKEE